jgi:hypothetical protein
MSPWQALDSVHGWRATETEWRRKLGDGYEAIRPLLTKDGGLASEVLLPDERRPRRVVMHSKADIVAIDRDTDHVFPVQLHDVMLHSLLPERLGADLSKHFHLGKSAATRSFGVNAWRLGEFKPYEGASFPTYLVLEPSPELCCNAIKTIAGGIEMPFVVLLLHTGNASDQVLEVAGRCKAGVVVVERAMMLLDGLAPHESFGIQLSGFVRDHVGPTTKSQAKGLRYPTPPGTKWSEVRIKLTDGESVTIIVRDQQQAYSFADLGLGKRGNKPSVLWVLLERLIADGGRLNWSSAGASRKGRPKQVKRLATALENFMGIEGDPLPFDRNKPKGWKALFQVEMG